LLGKEKKKGQRRGPLRGGTAELKGKVGGQDQMVGKRERPEIKKVGGRKEKKKQREVGQN